MKDIDYIAENKEIDTTFKEETELDGFYLWNLR